MRTKTNDGSGLAFGAGAARILFSRARSGGGASVIELTMPEGSAPPFHVHDEDETVFLLEGWLTFTVGDETIEIGPHTKIVLPAGVPHTYRVEHAGRARWVVVSETGRFERFVRAVGRPLGEHAAANPGLREAVAFTVAAAENGIEILAPAKAPAAERAPAAPARTRRRRFGIERDARLVPAVA
jgi:quercetin dioxygenase-like cupin family protein